MNELENSIKEIKTANEKLKRELDNAEQYSRRNCLLLHGVKETKKENMTDTFIDAMETHLSVELSSEKKTDLIV